MMQPKPKFKRGDVALLMFPNSDLETAKLRPALIVGEDELPTALIVQADELQTGISQIIVAMITSIMSRAEHSCRVKILLNSPEGRQSGLLTDSVVMTDNLATVKTSAIYRKIGSLPMLDIDRALKYTLGL